MKSGKRKGIRNLLFLLAVAAIICMVPKEKLKVHAGAESEPSGVVRISCVGDSLTYGFTSSDQTTQSYPAQLQKLLGDGYKVSNFGRNSATMLKNGNLPYWKQDVYTDSLNSNPDIVILMLGTNDSKNENWNNYKGQFESDMKEMIQIYRNLPTHPEVYIGLSPMLTVDTIMGLVNEVIINEIVPLQRKVAEEMDCKILDIFQLSQTMTGDFNDSVHPTDIGYQKIANYVYGELMNKDVTMKVINDWDPIQDGEGFLFSGENWKASTNIAGSINGANGDEHYAVVDVNQAASHYYQIEFTGNRIQVYGHLSPLHGIVSYSVDGAQQKEVSSYGPRKGNTLLYQASGLSDGRHVLKAAATGRKEEAAQGSVIQVDYAKVFTEKERISCTCDIERLDFTGQEIKIPWKEDSASIELHAEGKLTGCAAEGHENRKLEYEYSVEQDEESIGTIEGTVLSVRQPGTIVIQVKGSVAGTGIEKTCTAVFTVIKEKAPETETDPEPETEAKPDPKPDPKPEDQRPAVAVGKVTGLQAASSREASITLKWNKVWEAQGYLVYRRQESQKGWKLLADTSSPNYQDKTCKAAAVYQYRVQAYRFDNHKRTEGEAASLSAAAAPKPPKVTYTKNGSRIKLSWKKGTKADGFSVERKVGKKKYQPVKQLKANRMSYRSGKLKRGVSYRFRVRGYKKAGGKKYYSKYSKAVKVRRK